MTQENKEPEKDPVEDVVKHIHIVIPVVGAVLSFMLGLYIIYMLFTAFFSLVNAIIYSINKAVGGLLRKLPFGIGKKIRYKPIPSVSKNLFDLLLNKVEPIPPIF